MLVSVPWDGLYLEHISKATSLETYFTREPFMLGEPRKLKWPFFWSKILLTGKPLNRQGRVPWDMARLLGWWGSQIAILAKVTISLHRTNALCLLPKFFQHQLWCWKSTSAFLSLALSKTQVQLWQLHRFRDVEPCLFNRKKNKTKQKTRNEAQSWMPGTSCLLRVLNCYAAWDWSRL